MRLDNISFIEEGNCYLEAGFREDYNLRFGREAKYKESAHTELSKEIDLNRVLRRKEKRKISKSLEIHYQHTVYQILPKNNSRRLAGKVALISEFDDGIGIEYEYKIYNEQPYQEAVMDRKKSMPF